MSNNVLVTTSDSRQRILESARKEIEQHGILGLRVADVARGADTSITLIYRYFGDRDGLLAQVLGDLYYEFFQPYKALLEHLKNSDTPLTVQDLVDTMPLPDNPAAHDRRWILVQILAAAANNGVCADSVDVQHDVRLQRHARRHGDHQPRVHRVHA